MKILVAIKQVPERDAQIRIGPSGKWIEEAGLQFALNEPDAYALEEALQLKEKFGPAPRYYGYAEIKSKEKCAAFLNTGASVSAAWLNGVRIPIPSGAVGWHAGGHRLPIELKRGKNTLVIATGDMFFVSVTETDVW